MMDTIYVAALVAGGGFVLMSSVADLFGGDMDAGGDAEVEVEVDPSADPHAPMGELDVASFIPFLSFKFWTFASAFFGLTGFVLGHMNIAPAVTFIVALVMGGLSGFGISYALHALKQNQVGSMVTTKRLLGAEALVRVAVRGADAGTIQIRVGDRPIDMLAVSESPERIEAGSRVVIIAIEGNRAKVMPKPAYWEGDTPS